MNSAELTSTILGEIRSVLDTFDYAALDAAAAVEYADGKTYGDLLKEGKLPAPFSE